MPNKVKGVWKLRGIPDVWEEKVARTGTHIHQKPIELQKKLIAAVSHQGDLVVDPSAGSFSAMQACQQAGRNFIGCDLED